MMLTRLPSARRASTSGGDSSMRRPMRVTILVATFMTMVVVAEPNAGQFELAAPLDIDLPRPVDHDVGDGLVVDQRLERAEPEHVGDQRLDQLALLGEIELDLGFGQQVLDPAAELRLEDGARHLGGGGDVHVLEDERLDLRLCRLDRRAVRKSAARSPSSAPRRRSGVEQSLDQRGDQIAAGDRVGSIPLRTK